VDFLFWAGPLCEAGCGLLDGIYVLDVGGDSWLYI
jgi:hypothetical protein